MGVGGDWWGVGQRRKPIHTPTLSVCSMQGATPISIRTSSQGE